MSGKGFVPGRLEIKTSLVTSRRLLDGRGKTTGTSPVSVATAVPHPSVHCIVNVGVCVCVSMLR